MARPLIEHLKRLITNDVKAEAVIKAADVIARASFEDEHLPYPGCYPGWDSLSLKDQKHYAELTAKAVRTYLVEVIRIAKAKESE